MKRVEAWLEGRDIAIGREGKRNVIETRGREEVLATRETI